MADITLENIARISGNYGLVPMSMETQLETKMVEIEFVKTADKPIWAQGELTYTITVTNDADETLESLVLLDIIEFDKVSFIENSVMINGTPTSNYTYDDTTGELSVTVGNVAGGAGVSVSFRVEKV